MRWLLACSCLLTSLFVGAASAAQVPEQAPKAGAPLAAPVAPASLQFVAEHPVEGMPSGNLSGLALCGNEMWTVSDRDDDRIYRLLIDEAPGKAWQATAEPFVVPGAPESGLSWGTRARVAVGGLLRGGAMDFEGISCDQAGNRYVVSEGYAAVLLLPAVGEPSWLPPAQRLARHAPLQARAALLRRHVAPAGEAPVRGLQRLFDVLRAGQAQVVQGPARRRIDDGMRDRMAARAPPAGDQQLRGGVGWSVHMLRPPSTSRHTPVR